MRSRPGAGPQCSPAGRRARLPERAEGAETAPPGMAPPAGKMQTPGLPAAPVFLCVCVPVVLWLWGRFIPFIQSDCLRFYGRVLRERTRTEGKKGGGQLAESRHPKPLSKPAVATFVIGTFTWDGEGGRGEDGQRKCWRSSWRRGV